MPLMRAIRLLNSMEAGAITAAQLDTLLNDAVRAGEFSVMLTMLGQVQRMLASGTTLDILLSSNKALAVLLNSPSCRLALWQSDTALTALANKPSALTLIRAHARTSIINQATATAATPYAVSGITTPAILLGWSCNSTGAVTLTGRRADSLVGSLDASTNSIGGTSANFTNVMPLTATVTVANSASSRTHYFQIFTI